MCRKLLFRLMLALMSFLGQVVALSSIGQPSLIGQDNDPRVPALLIAGQQRLLQQQFYEAESYFLKVLELDDRNTEAHYYLADCKRQRFRYAEALSWYQAVENLDAGAYPQADYYRALMQKYTGTYRAAHQSFKAFIDKYQSSSDEQLRKYVRYATIETRGIELGYRLSQEPAPELSFQSLLPPINSPYHDYAAHILNYDSSLLISSTRPNAQGNTYDERYGEDLSDLFFWEKSQGQWNSLTSGHPLARLNSRFNEGSGAFNNEQTMFYYTECAPNSGCRIVLSQQKNGKWSGPQPLNELINVPGYTTKHPALSSGGDTLYFVSDRPGGYGQFDLWMSALTNGTWQAPINLGSTINTARNEVSPYYHSDGKVLLFASDGHIGLGGYDLYLAHHLDSNRNEAAVNLGYPFNSSKDDLYVCFGEREAFLTSNRDNEDGNFDLYTFIQPDDIELLVSRRPDTTATDWYALQFSTASLFSPEDRTFYEQLPEADKVNVQRYIQCQAFQEVVQQVTQVDTTQSSVTQPGAAQSSVTQNGGLPPSGSRYQYEELSEQEQKIVQRLARVKKEFMLKETTETILPEDRMYYESLASSEKQKITALVEQQWLKLLLQENTSPDAEAVYLFEKLPSEDQQKVVRAIQNQRQEYQKVWEQHPTLEDVFYYQSLPVAEKTAIEQMVAAQQFMEKVWEAQSDERMTYVYEQLNPAEQQSVKRYVERRSFQVAVTESARASEEVQQHYETLNTQEKEAIRRLARAKKQFLMKEPIDETSLADQQFYHSLPAQEKELVSRAIDAQVFALLVQDEVTNPEGDDLILYKLPLESQEQVAQAINRRQEFHQRTFRLLPAIDEVLEYQTLSDEEKPNVQRPSDVREFSTHESVTTSMGQDVRLFYEKLPRTDQESVNRMVEARKKLILKGEPTSLLAEDQYYLESLTTEEKHQVQRVIDVRVFEEIVRENPQTVQSAFQYQTLYRPDKQRIDRLTQTRRFFQQIMKEDASTPPEAYALQIVSEHAPGKVTITGRLASHKEEDFPTLVFLVNSQQDTLDYALVDADGGFTFTKIVYREDHRIAYDRPARSFSQVSDYHLEDLAIIPIREAAEAEATINLNNIYFATNQYALPESATSTLDRLVQFHRQHPQVAIDIRAFADSTGTYAYNLQLTQQRARAVQQYLEARGVASHCLSLWAMGSVAGGRLSLCRRVELRVGDPPALPASPQTVYIIRAKPDLSYIAERYGISLEKLIAWNGEKKLAPYTPVRVVIAPGR